MTAAAKTERRSFRPRFALRTLLVVMTVVALLTLPTWHLAKNWRRLRHQRSRDDSAERARLWLQRNQEQAASWDLTPAAGGTQESDLPGVSR